MKYNGSHSKEALALTILIAPIAMFSTYKLCIRNRTNYIINNNSSCKLNINSKILEK